MKITVTVTEEEWRTLQKLWIDCVSTGGKYKDIYNGYAASLLKKYGVTLQPGEIAEFNHR